MKNIFYILLIASTFATAQGVHFPTNEYFNASVSVDPGGSIKEKGLNFAADLELVSTWKYVKIGSQVFTALEGGYTDIAGGVGVNLTKGYFEKFRVYSGVRLGFIFRGSHTYPLAGAEAGIHYTIGKVFVGASGLYDYRSDFKYSGADPEMQFSGRVTVGTRF